MNNNLSPSLHRDVPFYYGVRNGVLTVSLRFDDFVELSNAFNPVFPLKTCGGYRAAGARNRSVYRRCTLYNNENIRAREFKRRKNQSRPPPTQRSVIFRNFINDVRTTDVNLREFHRKRPLRLYTTDTRTTSNVYNRAWYYDKRANTPWPG